MSGRTVPVFVALKPDERLHALVAGYKADTRRRVGPQLYLDDPPHLTLYLACFPAEVRLAPFLRDVVAGPPPPPGVRLVGWHVFANDPLTGRHTLACAIHPDDKRSLRAFQARIVAAVAPHRDRPATAARFAGRMEHLTAEQRANVAESGFPFLGDGWEPHFTVASIDPGRWDELWAELRDRPPVGKFACSAAEEYELDGVRPVFREQVEFAAGVPPGQ